MGPVVVCAAHVRRVNGELQHLHIGISAVPHQCADAIGHESQILGNDADVPQVTADGIEQLHAGSLLPMPASGGFCVRGDGEIFVKAPEMVNAHHVVELEAVPHPADPPGKVRAAVEIPVVQGISPDLTVLGECIRRTARNGGGGVVLVQLEQLRVRPDVRPVGRNVNGDVPHDLDVLAVGVGFQAAPLLVEFELHVLLELYVEVQLPVVMLQSKAPVHPDILRPGAEGLVVEEDFQRHEQGVVVQPPAVVPDEVLIVRIGADAAALVGLVQQGKTVLVELVEVHLGGVIPEADAVAFLPCQHALLHQRVQADEVGIARKGGVRLIGGIVRAAMAGSPQRQNLPVALTGLLQPVHEIIGRLVKTADAVFGRQTGNGQQYACISFHYLWLLASICP